MRNQQAKIGESQRRELIKILRAAAKDEKMFELFLDDLLTPNEMNELIARWQIVKQLMSGVSQRDISKNLHVTLVTINRGARMLENHNGGFNQVLSKHS